MKRITDMSKMGMVTMIKVFMIIWVLVKVFSYIDFFFLIEYGYKQKGYGYQGSDYGYKQPSYGGYRKGYGNRQTGYGQTGYGQTGFGNSVIELNNHIWNFLSLKPFSNCRLRANCLR